MAMQGLEKAEFIVDGLHVPAEDMRAIRRKFYEFKRLSAFEDRAHKEYIKAAGGLQKIADALGFANAQALWDHWMQSGEKYHHPLITSGHSQYVGPETETIKGRTPLSKEATREAAQRRTKAEIQTPTFKAYSSSLSNLDLHGSRYTREQSAIIFAPERRIKILAFAGTGKSTTLRGMALENRNKRILYIVFNKAAAESAKQKMPPNVVVKTQDALAYGAVINTFREKNAHFERQGRKFPSVSVRDVAKAEALSPSDAKIVLDTVTNFFLSADTQIQPKHLPKADGFGSSAQNELSAAFSQIKANDMMAAALKVANKIVSPTDRTYPCTFQGMMKVYQFQYPILDQYDLIMVDEAQDINEVFSSIIANQVLNNKRSRLVVVGDTHQNIYGFRGAKDFLPEFPAERTYTLTNSFRYGRGIALLASYILSRHKSEALEVFGHGKASITQFSIDRTRPYAIISRTNAELLDQVIQAVSAGKSVHFLGGLTKYRFEPIEDAYKLYSGGRANTHELKSFLSWEEFSEFASKSKDANLRAIQRVVSEHKHNTLNVIAAAKASAEPDRSRADVTVSTAHSCKGEEFDQVLLADDFGSLWSDDNPGQSIEDKQEVNLIYMALTRALERIELPPTLIDDCRRDNVSIDLINHCQTNQLGFEKMMSLSKQHIARAFRQQENNEAKGSSSNPSPSKQSTSNDCVAEPNEISEEQAVRAAQEEDEKTFEEIEDTLLKMLNEKL